MVPGGRWRAAEPRAWTLVDVVTWIALLVPTALVLGVLALLLAPPPPCPDEGICEGIPWLIVAGPPGLVVLCPLVILVAGFGRPRLRKPGPPVPRALVALVWTWMAGPALLGLHVLVDGRLPAAQAGVAVVLVVSIVTPLVVAATTRDLPESARREPRRKSPRPPRETVDWWAG
ncbi:hypothetical protein OEB99_02685 [Actinotalea sp. M2MS4P-6]|uniref:hypothetical protein n=1 Tax=Actinotalea sp. M2MS4P-6 TaxID=2983762 RepID=UPI0021E510D1|nr:hypothetical protein [Actinotalea sp. M2MS4P-6]MCV2393204.1 hypothetical protein [Actinotalea sp. M2MS4P-6]